MPALNALTPEFAERVRSAFLDMPDPEVTRAESDVRRARGAAEQAALIYLAQQQCPEDLVQFGQRHGIPEFAELTWQNGFQQGMRFAQLQRLQADMQTEAGAEVLAALRQAEAEVAKLRAALQQHPNATAPDGAKDEG